MAISTPMLVTFLVYIFGMILIGFLAWRSTKNFDDYILGGRSLGPMVTALSAGASDMSGWLLMGLPGAIFISVTRWPGRRNVASKVTPVRAVRLPWSPLFH
jgi:sodium/proline symporter